MQLSKLCAIGNTTKAGMVILLFFCAVFSFLMFWGLCIFHFPFIIPLLVFCSPFIVFLGYLLKNCTIDSALNNIVCCSMNYSFPFHFTRDANHARNARIDLACMKSRLEDGDIILRRYDHHLDGLIFKQNSYFTHAGICERVARPVQGGGETVYDYYVWHTTAAENVHRITLEEFCTCDEVAVFRLSPEQLPKNRTFTEAVEHIRKYGQGYKSTFTMTEQDIYSKLFEEISSGKKIGALNLDWELYRSTIVQKAKLLEGTLYDKEGDFSDPTKLCCIEYVWLCYLCLFPLHIMQFSNFRYFSAVNVLSLIPDVFIENNYFSCRYTSLENISDRNELIQYTNRHRVSFPLFVTKMVLWEFLFLWMIFLLNGLYKGEYLAWL